MRKKSSFSMDREEKKVGNIIKKLEKIVKSRKKRKLLEIVEKLLKNINLIKYFFKFFIF